MWQLCLAPQWHSSHNEYFWWNPSVYVVQKSLCSLKRTQRFLHCTEKSTAQSSEWRESHFSLGLDCMSKKMSNKYIFFLFLPTLFVSSLLVFLSWKLLHQNFLTFLWNQCFNILIICSGKRLFCLHRFSIRLWITSCFLQKEVRMWIPQDLLLWWVRIQR